MVCSKFLEILVKLEQQKELQCTYFRSLVFVLLCAKGNNLGIYISSISVFKSD